jgi:hypothetical protein
MNISPDQLPDGNDQTNQRPDLVPGVPLYLPGGVHNHTIPINPAAFAPPPIDPTGADDPGTGICTNTCGLVSRFGNAPNGLIRALHSWQIDIALTKITRITERVSTEFGVQFFNIFNHTQYGDPSTDNLSFNYQQALDSGGNPIPNNWIIQPVNPTFGQITSTNNFNNNNDNAASPNTGTGLPRQIQFMVRFEF